MAFTVQQINRTDLFLQALASLAKDYYELAKQQETSSLVGLPGAAGDYSPAPPGELDHLTRAKHQNAMGVFTALKTFMTTPVVLAAGNQAKAPLDAIVEALRGNR